MILYIAKYNDTDGCSYSCETILGVYDSRDKADECILREVETGEYNWRKLEDYFVSESELNVKWED